MQQIQARIKRERTYQIVEDSNTLPLPSTKSTAEVAKETFSKKSIQSTSSKTNGTVASKPSKSAVSMSNDDTASKSNGDVMSKPTGGDDQKPIENNARKTEKSTVASSA
jgi:hypothetical protein